MCMFVKLVFLNFRLIEDKFIQVHADESVQEKIASAPQLTKIGVSYGSNMLKFHTNSRSTLPPTNYRSRKHVNHFPQKLRFHDLALIFFLKQTKNTWKTNAQIRFVLDLAMLNTFQFGPGVPSQVVERPPRRPLGCVTNLQICWMLWHWTRCEKDWPASSTLCWQLSDDLKEQFSEVWLGTPWCTDTVSLYTNSGPSTWTIMFANQTCLATWIGRCMINQEVHHTDSMFFFSRMKVSESSKPCLIVLM